MNQASALLARRDFLQIGALGPLGRQRARNSCILIWQSGGCSHLDTFDMKPQAPREIRGLFRPISTSVPGIRICEHLPLTARHAHQFTVLRSVCSGETNHERASHYLRTGHPLSPGREFPSLLTAAAPQPGFLQQCLAAPRMVEAGARFQMLTHSGYDTHAANFQRLKDRLLPEFDRAFATLLQDLDDRGLLQTTLVIVMGEFGRSPRINAQGGRDHHAQAWSILLAGAGLPGGRALGATDSAGEEVTDLPVSPADLLRTIYSVLELAPAPYHLAAARVVKELLA